MVEDGKVVQVHWWVSHKITGHAAEYGLLVLGLTEQPVDTAN